MLQKKKLKNFLFFSLSLPCLQNLNYYVGNITVKHNDYDCMELKLFFFELLQQKYVITQTTYTNIYMPLW